MLNRRSASFRQPCRNSSPSVLTQPQRGGQQSRRVAKSNGGNQSQKHSTPNASSSGFKLVDMLTNQKNKIASIDIHSNPTLSHLNATIRKICRSNSAAAATAAPSASEIANQRIPTPPPPPGDSSRASTLDRRRKMNSSFEAFICDSNDYHHDLHRHHLQHHHLHHEQQPPQHQRQHFAAANHFMPLTVPDLSTVSRSNTMTTDIHSLTGGGHIHASNCNLSTAFRASNQSIARKCAASGVVGGGGGGGNDIRAHHALGCNSNSVINLKYGSLRSYKGIGNGNGTIGRYHRTKRSNSEQFNPSYYHFQNIDGDFGEMDNNAFDSVLLPPQTCDNHKLPWKHRPCPSITSSEGSTGSSGRSISSKRPRAASSFFIRAANLLALFALFPDFPLFSFARQSPFYD